MEIIHSKQNIIRTSRRAKFSSDYINHFYYATRAVTLFGLNLNELVYSRKMKVNGECVWFVKPFIT